MASPDDPNFVIVTLPSGLTLRWVGLVPVAALLAAGMSIGLFVVTSCLAFAGWVLPETSIKIAMVTTLAICGAVATCQMEMN